MAHGIIKLGGQYLVWSTVVDAPVTYGMTLKKLREHLKTEHGEEGLRSLPLRLERVEAKGTSFVHDDDVTDTIWLNRAGPGEKPLHMVEIEDFYVRRQEAPTSESLAAFREGLPECGSGCASRRDEFCERCWGTGYARETPVVRRIRKGGGR